MKLSAYPRTKPSGVEWLGDVPEHWETRRLKDVGNLRGGAGFPHDEQGVEDEELPFYKVGDLKASLDGRVMGNPEHTISKETAKTLRAAIIPPYSIVYAKIGAALLLNRRRVTLVHCCIDNNMTAYLPDKQRVRSEWAFYWLSTLDFGEFMNPGAVPSFSEGYQSILPVLVPPPVEQRAIAAFLDRETGRVDRLVAKKRELIERLKEKRTALISRTVTRGLPPAAVRAAGLPENPPLEPSGLGWLGDIPKHWEVRKFSREVAIAEGQVDPEKEPYAAMLLIGPEHVESGTGRLIQRVTAADQAAESGKYFSRKGDVIYSKIRPALRKLVIAPEDCLCSADMYPLRARKRLDNRFIGWFFLSEEFSGWSVLESDRVAMPKINRDTLNELRMPVPPLPEQTAIAAYLDKETAKLDALVGKVEAAVERLQEYRTAAVTGKIDVRPPAETVKKFDA
jgi:type I restriction enzyme, S subunit